MKTGYVPPRHMVTAILALIAVAAIVALVYSSSVSSDEPQLTAASAMKIVKAAHDYTAALRLDHKAIPPTVPLTNLVALKYLTPEDVAPFRGLDATLTLLVTNNALPPILLRVRQTDGSQTVLFADGSSQLLPADANR